MAGIVKKGFIGLEDIKMQTTADPSTTFTRLGSMGGTETLTKFPDLSVSLIPSFNVTIVTTGSNIAFTTPSKSIVLYSVTPTANINISHGETITTACIFIVHNLSTDFNIYFTELTSPQQDMIGPLSTAIISYDGTNWRRFSL